MRLFSHKPVRKEFDLMGDVSLRLQATKKVSDAKLAKDFQGVLVEFQNAKKIAWDREKVYIPFVPRAVPPAR
jgi:syntaxin 7